MHVHASPWIRPPVLLAAIVLALPGAGIAASAQQPSAGTGSHAGGGAATPSTGSGAAGSASGGAAAGGGSASGGGAGATAAAGQKVFQSAMPPCSTCHQVKPGIDQPGPSLAGVAARAKQRIASKDYKGKAKDARAYLRESIMDPNAYIVPGQGYNAGGQSLMPKTYAQALKPEQIDALVNYLMSLK